MLWPHQQVLNYQRSLFEAVNAGQDIVEQQQDRIVDIVKRANGEVQDEDPDEVPDPTDPEAKSLLKELEERFTDLAEQEQWEDVAASSIVPVVDAVNSGFEKTVERVAGVQPLRQDSKLQDFVEKKISDQVDLIKTLPERHFGEIKKTVSRAIDEGWSASKLEEAIPRAGATARYNAERIARDQVGNVSSEITKRRHEQAGFREFIWMTVGDSRVREEHQRRNGQRYRWDDPPDGETPGDPIQCRCVAQVVVEEAKSQFRSQRAA